MNLIIPTLFFLDMFSIPIVLFTIRKLLSGKQDEEPWFLTDEQIIKVSQDELNFIYQHCEKELKDTIDTAGIITSKTTTLLTVTVGLLAALIGYSLNRWEKVIELDAFMISSLEGCGYLFMLSILLSFNIIPRTYYALGGDPKTFFSEQLFKYRKAKTRIKMYYINEIESYRRRTLMNINMNRERQMMYKTCYIGLVLTPVVFILVYLMCKV